MGAVVIILLSGIDVSRSLSSESELCQDIVRAVRLKKTETLMIKNKKLMIGNRKLMIGSRKVDDRKQKL
jgi:hypothetical protein